MPAAPQPLEQLTPLVLNPRLNPKKPPAIEIINKVWHVHAPQRRQPRGACLPLTAVSPEQLRVSG